MSELHDMLNDGWPRGPKPVPSHGADQLPLTPAAAPPEQSAAPSAISDASTSTELRVRAVARLAEIAGCYDERLDVAFIVRARPTYIDILHRQALRGAGDDELLRGEVNALLDVAKGRAAALDDAIHSLGLPEQTRVQMTAEDVNEAFTTAWSDKQ